MSLQVVERYAKKYKVSSLIIQLLDDVDYDYVSRFNSNLCTLTEKLLNKIDEIFIWPTFYKDGEIPTDIELR